MTDPNPRCQLIKTEWTYEYRINKRVFHALLKTPYTVPSYLLYEIHDRTPVGCPDDTRDRIGAYDTLQACRDKIVELIGEAE